MSAMSASRVRKGRRRDRINMMVSAPELFVTLRSLGIDGSAYRRFGVRYIGLPIPIGIPIDGNDLRTSTSAMILCKLVRWTVSKYMGMMSFQISSTTRKFSIGSGTAMSQSMLADDSSDTAAMAEFAII